MYRMYAKKVKRGLVQNEINDFKLNGYENIF